MQPVAGTLGRDRGRGGKILAFSQWLLLYQKRTLLGQQKRKQGSTRQFFTTHRWKTTKERKSFRLWATIKLHRDFEYLKTIAINAPKITTPTSRSPRSI